MGLLFDLDGTLIDTWRLYVECIRRAVEPVLGRRVTTREIEAVPPSSEHDLLAGLVGQPGVSECAARLVEHYAALHDQLFDGVYPGVLEMVGAIKARGIRLGVVTGKSRTAWNITAQKSGLDRFDVVVTESDVRRHKPHPDGLLAALDVLRVEPRNALYVGDSLLDGSAAHAAGVPFGAALWPKAPQERAGFALALREMGAHVLFEAPADVLEAAALCPDTVSTDQEEIR